MLTRLICINNIFKTLHMQNLMEIKQYGINRKNVSIAFLCLPNDTLRESGSRLVILSSVTTNPVLESGTVE